MKTHAPNVEARLEREARLDIAHTLYKSLVAQYPDRLMILCDDCGLAVAFSTDYGPETAAVQNDAVVGRRLLDG